MQKFGVATFLMLVLVQTALSAPAENNGNNKLSTRKDADPLEALKEFTEKLKNIVEHEVKEAKAKFEGFVGHITSPETKKKIDDLLAQLANDNPAEATKKMVEEVAKIAQHELAGAKTKLDEFVKHVNSSETHKKVEALIEEVFKVNLAEKYQKIAQRWKNVADRDLATMKAKYDDLIAHLNTPEANQKLKDFLSELNSEKLAETCKKMTERMTNIVKQEFAGAKTKMEDLAKHVNSAETKKKFQDLMAEISDEKIQEIIIKVEEGVTKLVEKEVAAVKAKVEDLIGHLVPKEKEN